MWTRILGLTALAFVGIGCAPASSVPAAVDTGIVPAGGIPEIPRDIPFVLDGAAVSLSGGPVTVPSGTVAYFGNDARGDLNGDGVEDVAFLVTVDGGGSGTFFNVVAAVSGESSLRALAPFGIGDRIAPQTTEIRDGVLYVHYADRAAGEPMTATPSFGRTVRLRMGVNGKQLERVHVVDARISQRAWRWTGTLYGDGTAETPVSTERFVLTVAADGTFSATTDCNAVSGTVDAVDGSIAFGPIAMTRMFCEHSQERAFVASLERAAGYLLPGVDTLVLDLAYDTGTASFQAVAE